MSRWRPQPSFAQSKPGGRNLRVQPILMTLMKNATCELVSIVGLEARGCTPQSPAAHKKKMTSHYPIHAARSTCLVIVIQFIKDQGGRERQRPIPAGRSGRASFPKAFR